MSDTNIARRYKRPTIIILLLILIIFSCTYFYFWGESNYPSVQYITSHPEEFDNTTIIISGEIIEVIQPPPSTLNNLSTNNKTTINPWVLIVESHDVKLYIHTEEQQFNIDPKKGDTISCKGIYHKNNTIDAIEIHIADQNLVNLIFIRSIIAIPILIVIFISIWKFNFMKLLFEPREQNAKRDKNVAMDDRNEATGKCRD